MHDDGPPSPDAIRQKADELEARGHHETARIMRRVADDLDAQKAGADVEADHAGEA